jgi:Protein of unknown function (DUF3157)
MRILCLCILLAVSLSAQSKQAKPQPKPQATAITATTKTAAKIATAKTSDGKIVILKDNFTWEYTNEEPKPETASLDIEGGLILRNGNVVPIARAAVYLLDQDLTAILKKANIIVKLATGKTETASLENLSLLPGTEQLNILRKTPDRPYTQVMETIKLHVVKETSTDFKGVAQITDVPQGVYYVFAHTIHLERDHFWNVKADCSTKVTKIILDNKNILQ